MLNPDLGLTVMPDRRQRVACPSLRGGRQRPPRRVAHPGIPPLQYEPRILGLDSGTEMTTVALLLGHSRRLDGHQACSPPLQSHGLLADGDPHRGGQTALQGL